MSTSTPTVHVGDKVSFLLQGFHTIDLPKKGGGDVPLIVPGGGLVSGINDAAGNPFWFNGKVPNVGFNPPLFKLFRGKGVQRRVRGSTAASRSARSKPFVVTFTKAGTYKYYCDVHPGMVGTGRGQARGQDDPDGGAGRQGGLTKQATAAVKGALKGRQRPSCRPTRSAWARPLTGGVELFSMFPATLTVNANTTVTFQMSKDSFETHTATFRTDGRCSTKLAKRSRRAAASGPGRVPERSHPAGRWRPRPTTGTALPTPGVLDNRPEHRRRSPASGKIQFNAPGTYHYICLIHPVHARDDHRQVTGLTGRSGAR